MIWLTFALRLLLCYYFRASTNLIPKKELFRPQEKLLYNSHIQQSWVRIIL